MTERTFTIHREGIDRFTAIVDGDEVIAVRAADYDAMEIARDMCAHMAAEAEAELAHIKRFLDPTGWQKAQDEHNALRSRLADRTEERDDSNRNLTAALKRETALAARLQKVMARCADLLDEDQFNELDAIACIAQEAAHERN